MHAGGHASGSADGSMEIGWDFTGPDRENDLKNHLARARRTDHLPGMAMTNHDVRREDGCVSVTIRFAPTGRRRR